MARICLAGHADGPSWTVTAMRLSSLQADLGRCRARMRRSPSGSAQRRWHWTVAVSTGRQFGVQSPPRGLKRMRLTRMSQAIPVVALAGEMHVARPHQGTWVDMTEVESGDGVVQEGVPVFDSVKSDDDVDSLVEEPNVRVPSPRHSVVDALEFDLTREDSDLPVDGESSVREVGSGLPSQWKRTPNQFSPRSWRT